MPLPFGLVSILAFSMTVRNRKHYIPEASLSYSEGKGHANLHLVSSQDMRTASEVVGTSCKEHLAAAALAPEKELGDEPVSRK